MLVTLSRPPLASLPLRACSRHASACDAEPRDEAQLLEVVRSGATGRDFYPGIRNALQIADFLGLAQDSTTRLYLAAEMARERHSRLKQEATRVTGLLYPSLAPEDRAFQDSVCRLTQASLRAESGDQHLAESRFRPEASGYIHDPVATIEAIRGQIDDPKRRLNVAYAELDVPGQPLAQFGAVSLFRGDKPLFPYENSVRFPGPRVERTELPAESGEGFFAHDLGDGNPRTFDSEVRILDQLAGHVGPATVGTLRLHTERETCQSCRGVVEAFRLRHPGLRIEITYDRSARGSSL